jgi:uncharacterized protein (TIGR02996 family)
VTSDETALHAAIAAHPGEAVPLLMLADLRQENGDDFGAWMARTNAEIMAALCAVCNVFNTAVQRVADEHHGGNYAAALTALSEFDGRVVTPVTDGVTFEPR